MSNGMRIFETVTRKLRVMHNEEDLRELEKVSGDYYWARRESEQLRKELAAALPEEAVGKLTELQDHLMDRETIASDIFYNQGFADGVSLVMQSLMWETVRR
jgi:hypothetical protein